MKYLKQFEKNNQKMYWLLPTDNRFKKSLIQINCTERKIRSLLDSSSLKEHKYVFIGYDKTNYDSNIDFKWGWNEYRNKMTDDYYENNNFKFMGTVNIDESELVANKFNI